MLSTKFLEAKDYRLLNSGVDCKSENQTLGMNRSLSECADDCRALSECIYFIFGKRTNIIYTRLLYLRVFDPSL